MAEFKSLNGYTVKDEVARGMVDEVKESFANHIHTKAQITDFNHLHRKSEIVDFAHTHTADEIEGMAEHTHSKNEIVDFEHMHYTDEIIGLDDFMEGHTHTPDAVEGLSDFMSGHSHTADEVDGLEDLMVHTHSLLDLDGTLPINKGGTGATDSETARKNLGAMKMEQLWTNANTGSSFSPQIITPAKMGVASMTDYTYIFVRFVVSAGASTHQTSAPIFRSTGKYSTQYQNSSGNELRRLVSVTVSGGVEFEAGKRDETTDNTVMIPEAIWGVKL